MTPPIDDLRALLTAVAEGRVSPAEAAAQIGEPEATDAFTADVGTTTPGASATAPGTGDPAASAQRSAADDELTSQESSLGSEWSAGPDDRYQDASDAYDDGSDEDHGEPDAAPTVERLSLDIAYRTVRVIGDATVSGVTVEGPHQRHVDGTTVRIEASDPPIGGDAALFDESHGWRGWRNWRRLADDTRLVIRVPPELPIQLHSMASSVAIVRYDGELQGEAESSALRADLLKRPFDLSIRAGTIRLRAALTGGESRLHGDASAINVTIDPASDVRVALSGSMSRLTVSPELGGRRTGGPGARGRRRVVLEERYETTTGAGAGLLTIEANMSAVRLHDGGRGSSHGAPARGSRGARTSRHDRVER